MNVVKTHTDFHVRDEGSLVLVEPRNIDAENWLKNAIDETEVSWFGPALAVEPRYVHDLLKGAQDAGLTVLWPRAWVL